MIISCLTIISSPIQILKRPGPFLWGVFVCSPLVCRDCLQVLWQQSKNMGLWYKWFGKFKITIEVNVSANGCFVFLFFDIAMWWVGIWCSVYPDSRPEVSWDKLQYPHNPARDGQKMIENGWIDDYFSLFFCIFLRLKKKTRWRKNTQH